MLALYAEHHAPTTADPARIGYAIAALLRWWGESTVSHVTAATCRRYAATRGVMPGTVRRELTALRAAMNWCRTEGYLTHVPPVVLPPRPPGSERWLTRSEAALLLRTTRRIAPHLVPFVLVGLYTGTRATAILNLGFEPHPSGGWLDLDNGILHRAAASSRRTAKRQPPARLPARLIAHAKGWRRRQRWVVEWRGERVGSIKTAWRKTRDATGLEGLKRHTLRHTAITWAMQAGVPLYDAAGYFGITAEELERTYAHHHPDWQRSTADAMERGGRRSAQ